MSFTRATLYTLCIYMMLPAAERRNIILPADRAETHLDVYIFFPLSRHRISIARETTRGCSARAAINERPRAHVRFLRDRDRRRCVEYNNNNEKKKKISKHTQYCAAARAGSGGGGGDAGGDGTTSVKKY